MSEEMAVSDNTTGDEATVSNDDQTAAPVAEPEEVATGEPSEPVAPVIEESPAMEEDAPEPDKVLKIEEEEEKPAVKTEPLTEEIDLPLDTLHTDVDLKKEELEDVKDEFETFEHNIEEDIKRGIKRRASSAFSDTGDEDFKGFADIKIEIKTEDYSRVLERLEAEVTEASKDLVPIRTVMAAPGRASKRSRKDTDGSRPSSALSSRSDEGGTTDVSAASSPAHRGGRRSTIEMSSPLLRVPLERGWKRELVYRAALDAHSRRNADIYYYTPYGKKLRSTREVAEHLAGTGLTVENFSFFKEPLGVDDPEKEIIRQHEDGLNSSAEANGTTGPKNESVAKDTPRWFNQIIIINPRAIDNTDFAAGAVTMPENAEDKKINVCFFCNKSRKKNKGRDQKLSVFTENGLNSVKNLAIESNDYGMIQKCQDLQSDRNCCFHNCCKLHYTTSRKSTILKLSQNTTEWHVTRDIRAAAYSAVEQFVAEHIVSQGQVVYMKFLNEIFSEHLKNNQQDILDYSYKSYHLKERLLKKFSKKIKIIKFKGKTVVKPYRGYVID